MKLPKIFKKRNDNTWNQVVETKKQELSQTHEEEIKEAAMKRDLRNELLASAVLKHGIKKEEFYNYSYQELLKLKEYFQDPLNNELTSINHTGEMDNGKTTKIIEEFQEVKEPTPEQTETEVHDEVTFAALEDDNEVLKETEEIVDKFIKVEDPPKKKINLKFNYKKSDLEKKESDDKKERINELKNDLKTFNEKYKQLQLEYSKNPSEELRHEMITILAMIDDTNKDLGVKPKKDKFSLLKKKAKPLTLKSVEAYCPDCKHTIQDHIHKKRSAGCRKCTCLMPINEILLANKINPGQIKMNDNSNMKICSCGHKVELHVQGELFCEISGCQCTEFSESNGGKQ